MWNKKSLQLIWIAWQAKLSIIRLLLPTPHFFCRFLTLLNVGYNRFWYPLKLSVWFGFLCWQSLPCPLSAFCGARKYWHDVSCKRLIGHVWSRPAITAHLAWYSQPIQLIKTLLNLIINIASQECCIIDCDKCDRPVVLWM